MFIVLFYDDFLLFLSNYLQQNEIRQEKEELQKSMQAEDLCETLAKQFLQKKVDLLPIHPNRFFINSKKF